MPTIIFFVLIGLIVAIMANEYAFQGTLFSSQMVGGLGALGVLAAVFGMPLLGRYQGRGTQALLHIAIWLGIILVLVAGYRMFG
ncbi:MAG: hypothetical protein Q8M26_16740 [Pseudolabrys sp.]|nr:hypothetical protein [Pseudolabrys sp.]